MPTDAAQLLAKAERIKMIVLDNDGVLTDGRVYISAEGVEAKAFDIRDGFGVVLARRAGVSFAVITGLLTPIIEYRARQLGIEEVHQGFTDKLERMKEIIAALKLDPAEVAYMGDDLFDLPVMRFVGLGAAPADAHPLVAAGADWVSSCGGGRGAVRDLIELVLKARGQWEWALGAFVGE